MVAHSGPDVLILPVACASAAAAESRWSGRGRRRFARASGWHRRWIAPGGPLCQIRAKVSDPRKHQLGVNRAGRRSHLTTARNHGLPAMHAIHAALLGNPWRPVPVTAA